MNRLIKPLLAVSVSLPLLWACSDKAPEPAESAAIAEAASEAPALRLGVEQDLHRHTEELASDEYEGRAPSTPGEELTVNYIARQFEEAGLEPGNGDSWFQEVPISSMTAAPANMVIEAPDYRRELAFGSEFTAATQRQMEQVGLENAPLVFVGYGINAPERNWNDYAGIDVTGKTVVVLVNDPGYATQDPEVFNGNTMTYYGRWSYKYEEAARQGAAGVLIVHETAPAAYPWKVVELGFTGAQMGITADDQNRDAVPVEGWITHGVAKELMAAAGLVYDDLKAAAAKPGFKAVPMGELAASIQLDVELSRSLSRNVVGVLPGQAHPDETIVYTAHWDHFGVVDGVDEGEDNIYNGAVDNASGVAGLISLARLHAEHGPYDRSFVFLAVTAEEFGLLGAKYYVEDPLYPLETTVANLNMDSLYKVDGRMRDVAVVGFGNSELESYLEVEADRQDRVLTQEPNPEKGYYYRSDHFAFARKGVPALYLTNASDSREHGKAWGQNQLDAYVANDYHKPTDEYSSDWDMSGAAEDVLLFFGVGESLASSRDWPNWHTGNEFKAARDETSEARAE